MEKFLMNLQEFTNSWWPFCIACVVTIITSIKIYFGGTYCPSKDQLNGRTVVITGAANGIGFETAKELAKRNGKIILAVRNLEKGRDAVERIRKFIPDAQLILKLVDMCDFSSIRNFAQDLINDDLNIDILINNAAVIFQPFELTNDGHEKHLATNYYGPFLLTHLLLPLLKKSNDARVINVSSLAHFNAKLNLDDLNLQKSFNPADAFAQSKLCLTMFTKHIAQYFKKTPITFNAVTPGLVRGTNHMNQSILNKNFMTKLSVMPWIWLFMKSPKQGSQSIVYLAVDLNLQLSSGNYFSECEVKEPAPTVNNQELCALLYERTCKIVGIPFKPLPHFENADTFSE